VSSLVQHFYEFKHVTLALITKVEEKAMAKKTLFWVMLVMVLVFGMMVVGCVLEEEPEPEPVVDNTIYSIEISLGWNDVPKVGSALSTTVKNISGSSVSGVSYQWKRADTQFSTFVNISNATSSSYTLTIEDTDKYIKVQARNNDTASPVESTAVGPVDGNKVDKPMADLAGGDIVSGREITLTTTTENATIYYTLDGTTPTTNSNEYDRYEKPEITSSCTLKAIATKSGMVDSEVLSVSYTVVAAPSFSSVTSTASIFDNGIYSVTYGNNRFVAGGNNRIAYSSNGTTWTASTGNSNFIINGIIYGTRFVAVGYGYDGIINYSSDGTSWSNVTDTTFGESDIEDVAYGGGRYVAVGENGKIAYSTNGTSWTAATDSTFGTADYTSTIYGITYGAGKFVVVGSGGKIAYSTNGTTWTAVDDSKLTGTINGITYGGPAGKEKFIAVGSSLSSYQIAYSTDGITWTRVSQYFSDGGLFSSLNRVAWGGNKYVAVASSGVMYFSLDGTYWAKIEGGTGVGKSQFDSSNYSSINDIVYGGGKFLAVGDKSTAYIGGDTTGEMAISN
jgi:hypothetical protein